MYWLKGTLVTIGLTVAITVIVLLMTNGVRMINRLFTRSDKTHDKFSKEGM